MLLPRRLAMKVIKKDGSIEPFNPNKIIGAISKATRRCMTSISTDKLNNIIEVIEEVASKLDAISIAQIQHLVVKELYKLDETVASAYDSYKNYKTDLSALFDEVYTEANKIRFLGDTSNANSDSSLVSTRRALTYDALNRRFYRKFFLNKEENIACKDGFIYPHDQNARLDTINCFERSTRFITSTGVKSFYDFSDGDEIIVLSHTGKWRKAIVHSYGWQKIQKVTFKRGSGKEKSVLVTPNHRWILKDGSETTSLKVGDKLISAPCVSKFECNELSRKDKKLWCLGFGLGDGSIISDNKMPTMHIRLFGHKKQYANMFIEAGYNVTSPKSLNGALEVRMTDVRTKELPYLQLNNENIKYLMNGYLCADGHINGGLSEFRGVQVTGNVNKHIYDLLNIAGYYVTNVKDLTGQVTNYGIRTKNTKSYQIHSNQGDRTWKVKSIEDAKLNPKAKVWCLDVEVDHSFILENGIPTGNCCLFNVGKVMKDGFEMGNIHYNEPKTLDVAFDVIGDIILSCASQQYGGFTVPEIDKILTPYAIKSHKLYTEKYRKAGVHNAVALADADIAKDFTQGFQGLEMKLNSVGSSRGDYPFVTFTFGLDVTPIGKLCNKSMLKVRMEGQGAVGHKRPVLFPKLVMLFDDELHNDNGVASDVFKAAIKCTSKCMYPDYISLTGDGAIADIYKKYHKPVSCMGCRSFLSPYFIKGGYEPFDDNDTPIYEGRFNIGVVSINLPMIYMESIGEGFYEHLHKYLEMVRNIHVRTKDYLGNLKASMNPVGFMQGGFYGGNLGPNDKIEPVLKYATASLGITASSQTAMSGKASY